MGWLIFTGRDPMGGGAARVAGWLLAVATYAAMFAAGILLMRRSGVSSWLMPLVLGIQIPILEYRHFSYAILPFPRIEWGLLPLFGPTVGLQARMAVTIDHADRPFSLAVNVVAVTLFIWCDRYYGLRQPVGERAG